MVRTLGWGPLERKMLALLSALALFASLVAIYAPVARAQTSSDYDFVFANGTHIQGTSSTGDVDLRKAHPSIDWPDGSDGKDPLLHVSCSEKYPGGFSSEGHNFPDADDPDHVSGGWQVASYTIHRTLGGGQVRECGETFVPGNVKVIKNTDPTTSQSFSFNLNGIIPPVPGESGSTFDDTQSVAGNGGSYTWTQLDAGEYTLSELTESNPEGYEFDSLSCTSDLSGFTFSRSGASATFDLHGGEDVTCTFSNVSTILLASVDVSGECVQGEEQYQVFVTTSNATVDVDLDGDGVFEAGETDLTTGAYDASIISGSIIWEATADPDAVFGEGEITSGTLVFDCDILPVISVVKTADPTSVLEPGGDVEFTVTVSNDSVEAVTITSITDDVFGNLSGDGDCQVGTGLAPGGSCSFTFVGTVFGDAGDVHVNTVTVTAEDDEQNQASDSDDATVEITDVLPLISVVKTADPTSVLEPGGDVEFTVTVSNDSVGSVTITSITDDVFGTLDGDSDCEVGTMLAPGGSCSFTFTEPVSGDAGDVHVNTVTVVAIDREENESSDSDDATVEITEVLPQISVTKSADPTSVVEPGGSVTFTVTVSNPSASEAVTVVSIVDDIFGDLSIEGAACLTALTPGDSCQFSFTETVSGNAGSSHTNTVTVVGVDDEENEVQDSDDATVDITDVLPLIVVDKSADTNLANVGEVVTFTVEVTNTSVESVTITSLVDSVFGDLNGPHACAVGTTLASGGSCQFTFQWTVGEGLTDAEIEALIAGGHSNTVTVDGMDDEGNPAGPAEDTVEFPITEILEVVISPPTELPFTGIDADRMLGLAIMLMGAGMLLLKRAPLREIDVIIEKSAPLREVVIYIED